MKDKKNYSKELKEKVVQEALETGKIWAVADKYEIKRTTVYGWIKSSDMALLFKNENICFFINLSSSVAGEFTASYIA